MKVPKQGSPSGQDWHCGTGASLPRDLALAKGRQEKEHLPQEKIPKGWQWQPGRQ